MRRHAPIRVALATSALVVAVSGCLAAKKREATYTPSENVLEIVSVLRRHVPDDTYRFAPATDFSGRNVYRATLLRLESAERLHAEALAAGHFAGVVAMAKGRALERLRAYPLAAERYRDAAEAEPQLAETALASAEVCEALAAAVSLGIDLRDPLPEDTAPAYPLDVDATLEALDERVARLELLLRRVVGTHYAPVAREEIERTDRTRARYFVALRGVLRDGNVRAVGELQRLVSRHPESKNIRLHTLELADFFASLAGEYAAAHPPESLRFDPPKFRELVDSASHLYQRVAGQDGTPEKLVAARRLEAFLAFTLKVDRDRFTP
ncbi:MAG: hypothetical protein MJE66_14305 [Proteobacteria bacterium]|nr:hypothetical protein [Pseudomonadota bacterium]